METFLHTRYSNKLTKFEKALLQNSMNIPDNNMENSCLIKVCPSLVIPETLTATQQGSIYSKIEGERFNTTGRVDFNINVENMNPEMLTIFKETKWETQDQEFTGIDSVSRFSYKAKKLAENKLTICIEGNSKNGILIGAIDVTKEPKSIKVINEWMIKMYSIEHTLDINFADLDKKVKLIEIWIDSYYDIETIEKYSTPELGKQLSYRRVDIPLEIFQTINL